MSEEPVVKRRRGRPRSPDYQKRRQQIAASAAHLFVAEGVASVSMDDLAEEVGLAKASLYHYFRTKDDILFAIHEQTIGFLTSALERRRLSGSGPRDRLHGLFIDTLAMVDELPGYSRVVMEQLRQLQPDLRRTVVANQERYSRDVQQIFADGIAAGEIRPGDTHLYTLALLGMVNWTHQWYSPGGAQTPRELADQFFSIFIDGVSSDPS